MPRNPDSQFVDVVEQRLEQVLLDDGKALCALFARVIDIPHARSLAEGACGLRPFDPVMSDRPVADIRVTRPVPGASRSDAHRVTTLCLTPPHQRLLQLLIPSERQA